MSRLITFRLARASQYCDLGQSNQLQSTSRRFKAVSSQRRNPADTADKTHGTPFTDDSRQERRGGSRWANRVRSVYITRIEKVDGIVAGLVSEERERHALVKNVNWRVKWNQMKDYTCHWDWTNWVTKEMPRTREQDQTQRGPDSEQKKKQWNKKKYTVLLYHVAPYTLGCTFIYI